METKSNPMSILVECEDCKNKFSVNKDNLNQREFTINEQSIFLTYYDCPSCGRRHYVQIDNWRTLSIYKDVKRQMTKLMVLRRKGKTIPQKQQAKFEKTRKHLAKIRTELMKDYTGKLIYDNETDVNFELKFSV